MQNAKNLVLTGYVRKLIVLTYQATARFPNAEHFGLGRQMRRAAISIGSNIAEGCRRSTDASFRRSLDIAMGEASELEFQCIVAADLKLGEREEVEHLTGEAERVKRMLARLIVALRGRERRTTRTRHGTSRV